MDTFVNQPCYILIKDLITAIFTGAGLIIAAMGLATWKKQIKGTKEFETAYNLNYSVLKLRDAIKHVRHPAIFPSESSEAAEYAKAKHPEKSAEEMPDNNASVYEMRWEKIMSASTEMESHMLAAEVLWGSGILDLIKPLNKKITELNIGLMQFFQPRFRTSEYAELEKVIYGNGDGSIQNDPFAIEVNQIIQKISNYLKAKMS